VDKFYENLVRTVCTISSGMYAGDYNRTLRKIAKSLKNVYSIEPVDIVAALCLFEKGKYDYARILLKRACNDLIRIGKERGLM